MWKGCGNSWEIRLFTALANLVSPYDYVDVSGGEKMTLRIFGVWRFRFLERPSRHERRIGEESSSNYPIALDTVWHVGTTIF